MSTNRVFPHKPLSRFTVSLDEMRAVLAARDFCRSRHMPGFPGLDTIADKVRTAIAERAMEIEMEPPLCQRAILVCACHECVVYRENLS